MATKPTDSISKELSSFFKQAVETFDEVKETVLKGSSATKATVDVQLLKRSRERALARLGEVMLDEATRGARLPAAGDVVVKELRELDEQIAKAKAEADTLWSGASGTGKPPAAQQVPTPAPDDDDD